MSETLHFAVIVASVHKDRVGPMVARWFLGEDTEVFTKRIDWADAVIVVTPEYNRGYPGALKTAIDTALPEWRAKPVGFVSYGGISGGLRAIEQLREHGDLRQPERAASPAATLLRQLTWWAKTLRQAKSEIRYDG